jgi:hypothetical protein
MLTLLCRVAAVVAYQIVQEYRALEELAIVSLGIADDEDIGADDPEADIYATRTGFSAEPGRLRKED